MLVLGAGVPMHAIWSWCCSIELWIALFCKACLPTWVFIMSDANGTCCTEAQTKTSCFSVTSEMMKQPKVAVIYWQLRALKPRAQSYNAGQEVANLLRASKYKGLKLGILTLITGCCCYNHKAISLCLELIKPPAIKIQNHKPPVLKD